LTGSPLSAIASSSVFHKQPVKIEIVNGGPSPPARFSPDGGRSAGDQLGLDAETPLDTSLDVPSQLGAGGNGDDNLPSFLAASTIFHSFCAGCPVCARPTLLSKIEPAMKTKRNKNFMCRPKVLYSPKSFRATAAPGSLTL
jgi:hypothetical protein